MYFGGNKLSTARLFFSKKSSLKKEIEEFLAIPPTFFQLVITAAVIFFFFFFCHTVRNIETDDSKIYFCKENSMDGRKEYLESTPHVPFTVLAQRGVSYQILTEMLALYYAKDVRHTRMKIQGLCSL